MTTTPKITIIIPVYNVEKYLRQCLDSVVNQTMRDIQIICVNDGSTDGSLAILREYEACDSRVEIIDKPNGGQSSARNAAYPHIKGKYTLFIDSDDWIELDLCEKTYHKSEATGASMTVFFYQGEDGQINESYLGITSDDKTTVEEKLPFLDFAMIWDKFWRTDFLLDHKLYFPEGLIFEDSLVHWQAVTLADKISVVPERLYHYRCTPGSTSQTKGDHVLNIFPIYHKIRDYLLESGYYVAYRNAFSKKKLFHFYECYHNIPTPLVSRYFVAVREALDVDDWKFFRTASKEQLPKNIRLFYEMIDGGPMEAMNYHVSRAIQETVKMPERFLRRWIIKPIKKRLKVA